MKRSQKLRDDAKTSGLLSFAIAMLATTTACAGYICQTGDNVICGLALYVLTFLLIVAAIIQFADMMEEFSRADCEEHWEHIREQDRFRTSERF